MNEPQFLENGGFLFLLHHYFLGHRKQAHCRVTPDTHGVASSLLQPQVLRS